MAQNCPAVAVTTNGFNMTTTLRKKYFEHGLANTPESRKALARLAVNLKAARTKAGLSMTALAEKVGCSHYVIAHVEQAQNFPSWPVYVGICRVLRAGRVPLT
jgi:DNA-binding XRE family transcriptional regulator